LSIFSPPGKAALILKNKLAEAGLEPVSVNSNPIKELRQLQNDNSAKYSASQSNFINFPPELVEVVVAWDGLPKTVQDAIVAQVRKGKDAKI
jgi:hypothetical protein